MKKIAVFIVLSIVIILITSDLVLAHDNNIDGGVYDSTSKFKLVSSLYHAGTVYTEYYFNPVELYSSYNSYMSSASSAWGSYLNVGFDEDASSYVRRLEAEYPGIYASCTTPSSAHDSIWRLTIYWDNFDPLSSSTQKARIIAHELAHGYGVSHVPYSSCIMYSYQDPMPSPTTYDKWGVRNCTHNHMTHWLTIYDDYGNTQYHKNRCTTCSGFRYQVHDIVEGECTECGYIQ